MNVSEIFMNVMFEGGDDMLQEGSKEIWIRLYVYGTWETQNLG
jgi:hypothetical protein